MTAENVVVQAIHIAGSEAKLAEAVGCSQPAINKAKRRAEEGHRISPRLAAGIHRATEGRIPRWQTRPDLWDPPGEGAAA